MNPGEDPAAQVALSAALMRGTLPITSACNFHCFFCSNHQNPPGVKTFRLPHRTLDEVRADIELLPRSGRIVIGEAATRIDEGEPFLHPEVETILSEVRAARPRAELVVTTNGSLLDERRIAFLASLAPLSVNLSLNLLTPAARQRWLGDRQPSAAPTAARLLTRYGISWTGSLVGMPHVTGWEELDRTLRFLAEAGAQTARLFLPGFTRLAPSGLIFGDELWPALRRFGQHISADTWLPVTVEPPGPETLDATVVGVIRGSAAARAGLQAGDVITDVAGEGLPQCRVDCHRQLLAQAGRFAVTISRGGKTRTVAVDPLGSSAAHGVVLDYDIDPHQVDAAAALIRRSRGETLILTGALAAPLVELALRRETTAESAWSVVTVPNRFFGGSIMAAGLLTVDAIIAAGAAALAERAANDDPRPTLIIIPGLPFDDRGHDLVGRSYLEISDALGVPVELIR